MLDEEERSDSVEKIGPILKYAHHLNYARLNDPEWRKYCSMLSEVFFQNSTLPTPKCTRKILLTDLPDELLMHILRYFDFKSLCYIAGVNRYFSQLSDREEYWENLMLTSYNISSESCIRTESFKVVFRNTCSTFSFLLRNKSNLSAFQLPSPYQFQQRLVVRLFDI